jgi:hypothetical protein
MVPIVHITIITIVIIIRQTTEAIMVEVANLLKTEIRQIQNARTTTAIHRRQTEATAAVLLTTALIAAIIATAVAALEVTIVAPLKRKIPL